MFSKLAPGVRSRIKANSYAVKFCSPLKKYLSVRSHELLPRKYWKLVFLPWEWVGIFSMIYPELFPASPGAQVQEITVNTFSTQLGQSTVTISDRIERNGFFFFPIRLTIVIVLDPVGSKKCWRWFPATGPLEKRETALDRSWRKLRLIRRARPISNISELNSCERTEGYFLNGLQIQLHKNWPKDSYFL